MYCAKNCQSVGTISDIQRLKSSFHFKKIFYWLDLCNCAQILKTSVPIVLCLELKWSIKVTFKLESDLLASLPENPLDHRSRSPASATGVIPQPPIRSRSPTLGPAQPSIAASGLGSGPLPAILDKLI